MFGIVDLSTYLVGTLVVILLPGPNSMYCLAVAGQQGTAAGYRAIGGVLLGDSLLMLATVLGAGTLFRLYPAVFDVIRLAGGVYLFWLGINLLGEGWQRWRHYRAGNRAATARVSRSTRAFRRSLLLSLTNPKAILFFLSFFVQFVDPAYPYPGLSFLVLALILQFISFLYLNLLVLAGGRLVRAFGGRPGLAAAGLMLAGLLFIGFAGRMWVGDPPDRSAQPPHSGQGGITGLPGAVDGTGVDGEGRSLLAAMSTGAWSGDFPACSWVRADAAGRCLPAPGVA